MFFFEGSNSYSNLDFDPQYLAIEILIETLEVLERDEEYLFEDEDEESE